MAYSENGSVQNEHVGSQNINTIGFRTIMEAHLNELQIGNGIMRPSWRIGAEYQTYLGNRAVDVNTLGTNLNFNPTGGTDYVDGIIGATLSYALNTGLELYTDAEGDIGLSKSGSAQNAGITGRLGARWKF